MGMACKVKSSKETTGNNTDMQNNKPKVNEQASIENKTLGKVSHKYRASGCNTVIEVKLEGDEIQTLIPKDKLAADFDIDGLEVYFNFLVLRMPQPKGCSVGQPAEINDLLKKQ
jgi:hypothetical protein